MDSYYSSSPGLERVQQVIPYSDSKYSPTFMPGKGQAHGDKQSPFQQDYQELTAESIYNKYHLFMQRPTCKTPTEDSKLLQDDALISCYGELL